MGSRIPETSLWRVSGEVSVEEIMPGIPWIPPERIPTSRIIVIAPGIDVAWGEELGFPSFGRAFPFSFFCTRWAAAGVLSPTGRGSSPED
jgi:hypothetical protein